MRTLIPPPWTAAKALTVLSAAGLALSGLSLAALLAATPPYECGRDYDSPTTPLHSGLVSVICLLYAVVAVLVAAGVKIGLPRTSRDQRWATRAIVLSTLLLGLAAVAVAAAWVRWVCHP
jgi:hypothetical protein